MIRCGFGDGTGAWSMGSRLGSLDGWNGDHTIHILSAGSAFFKIT